MKNKLKEKISQLLQLLKNRDSNSAVVLRNVFSSFAIRGFSLIISLATMPAYMRFFESEEVLGVWFTVLSVLTWILNFDLGIGNGLRNNLTAALVENESNRIKGYISSAYVAIGAIVIVILGAGMIAMPYVDWNFIIGVSQTLVSHEVLTMAIQLAFIGMMLQFFLRLITSILYAMQKSAMPGFLSLITSILQLVFAIVAPSSDPSSNLIMFSASYIFCVNIPLLAATVYVFSKPLRNYRPSVRYFSIPMSKEVLNLGGIFFLCQVLYMFIANTNEFFISHYTSPAYVVEYQIYYKIFSLAGTLLMLGLTPIWSAVSKALAEKDLNWVQQLYKKLKWIALGGVLLEFMMIPFLQLGIDIWLGSEAIRVDPVKAIIMSCAGAAMLYQSMLSSIVCGMGRMKLQAISYSIGVVAKILIIIIGINSLSTWTIIPLANAIVLIPYCVIQQIDLNKVLKNNCEV